MIHKSTGIVTQVVARNYGEHTGVDAKSHTECAGIDRDARRIDRDAVSIDRDAS